METQTIKSTEKSTKTTERISGSEAVVKSLIAEKLEVEDSKITLDSSFRKDLGADSLDTYELVYAIEEELGVSIPDEKANDFETVRNAVDFLSTLLK